LRNRGEKGIAGVLVTLVGVDVAGRQVVLRTMTNAQGNYFFTGILPGTYALIERQPRRYADGRDRPGTHGGFVRNDVISGIRLGPNEAARAYLFGELPISKRFLLSSRTGTRSSV